jgi:hypothetical protein
LRAPSLMTSVRELAVHVAVVLLVPVPAKVESPVTKLADPRSIEPNANGVAQTGGLSNSAVETTSLSLPEAAALFSIRTKTWALSVLREWSPVAPHAEHIVLVLIALEKVAVTVSKRSGLPVVPVPFASRTELGAGKAALTVKEALEVSPLAPIATV